MPRQKILVVDDEDDILELVRYNLHKNGYEVSCVTSGEAALGEARANLPDLIVLDLMLPGIDGLEVCRKLKKEPRTAAIPILMLTARGEEADVVTGLELGADDYVTKPFSPKVLTARVRTILRRRREPAPDEESLVRVHELEINPGRHHVLLGEQNIALTSSEFKLLHLLARRPGWVFTRDQIIDRVHGEGYSVTDRSVDVLVAGLRKKLGPAGKHLETVRGVGYRFKE